MIHAAPTFTDDSARRDWFNRACDLLGGQRAMARALDVAERSVRAWASGYRGISDGVVADVVRALRRHADACRTHADLLPP